ncbi:MAG: hypothetical protein FJ088_05895 [Deltaproteobacteria bacterium]|nr:hypothetical protein [Deltaproteobacteria bacterium]
MRISGKSLLALLVILLFPLNALGYLDPGSGSYFIQIVIAAVLGGLFFLKVSWQRVSGFFRKLMKRQNKNEE